MKTFRVAALSLSLAVLAAGGAPAVAQNRSPRRAVNPSSPPVTLAPGQKARLVVGAWDLDNDGAPDPKGGVTLTLKFLPYANGVSEGDVTRLRQVGERSSSPVFVPAGQIVKYEWDFNAWDLDNDGQFEWDINNDGAIRAAVEGAGLFADGGNYRVYDGNRTYAVSVALEVVEKATGKVVLRLGGQDWE
jgi:hypothetical protein